MDLFQEYGKVGHQLFYSLGIDTFAVSARGMAYTNSNHERHHT